MPARIVRRSRPRSRGSLPRDQVPRTTAYGMSITAALTDPGRRACRPAFGAACGANVCGGSSVRRASRRVQRVGAGQQHLSLDRVIAAPLHGEPGGGDAPVCGSSDVASAAPSRRGTAPRCGSTVRRTGRRGSGSGDTSSRSARGGAGHRRHGHAAGPSAASSAAAASSSSSTVNRGPRHCPSL